jgi:amino acid transporter
VDSCLINCRLAAEPLQWGDFGGGFGTLVAATSPVFWTFFLLTGVSLIVLRFIDPEIPRPFKTPL